MNIRITKTPRASAENIFALVALVFGLFFVFATPLLWGSDETSHTGRVYQISQGHIFAHVVHQGYSGYGFGGTIPSNLMKVVDYVNTDFNVNSHQVIPGVKWVDNPADYKEFSKLPLSGPQLQYNFSNTATYSPLSYVPSVIGFKLAQLLKLHIGPTIYLTRIFGLLFYVLAIWYLLRAMYKYRIKWLIFTIALLPMALFQASTINADFVTNALTLIVVGLVVKALLSPVKLTVAEATVLIISTIGLPIVKPAYLFISLLALLVPVNKIPFHRYARFIMPASVASGIVLYGAWQFKTRYLSNAPKYIIAGVVPWWQQIDSSGQLIYIAHHPVTYAENFFRTVILTDNIYFESLFGRLGFDYVQIPAVAIIASLVALVLGVAGAEVFNRSRKVAALMASIIVLSIGAVFTTLYLTISSVGATTIQGVQGRYLLPILPLFTLLVAYLTSNRLKIGKRSYRNFAGTICGLVTVSLLFSAVKFYYITWG